MIGRPLRDVVVVGSINLDLSVLVDRFPLAGETVHGLDVIRGGGGKGANQAVAAARLGRSVAMVGAVGDDEIGAAARAALASEGIDVDSVETVDGTPTGLAVIEVDAAGENRIVVVAGANSALNVGSIDEAGATIAGASVVLTQLEIPLAAVVELAAVDRVGRLVLNPAPAPPVDDPVFASLLTGTDVIIPNKGELATMVGEAKAITLDEVVDQVGQLGGGVDAVVVTLGSEGVVVVSGLQTGLVDVSPVAAAEVDAIDTTAAGDAFCGGFADSLCAGADYVEAARWATRVAAVTVTRRGAQDALPSRADVVALT